MIVLAIIIAIYSIAYLVVYINAHKDANMIKPLTTMTGFMLILLLITAFIFLMLSMWYVSLLIVFVMIGLFSFFMSLL